MKCRALCSCGISLVMSSGTFKMRVVNTKDSKLVYTSEEGKDFVKLLIPALGYSVCYRVYSERQKPLKIKDFCRFLMPVCRLFVA